MAKKTDMPRLANAKNHFVTGRPYICHSVILILTIAFSNTNASLNVLPHPCDKVKCPPMSKIVCPEDSEIRESISPIALLQPHSITATPPDEVYNSTEIANDLYAKCCLTKKCLCKTCYIPSCQSNDDVVIELQAESMETPGQCCGKYECRKLPNCSEIHETEINWLTDCQRCKCYSGVPICHQTCDEGTKKVFAMCSSKTLNAFFEHGQSWKEGCEECECVHGEEKCVMPFCRRINCPVNRQVMLKDSCCPICWPKNIPMPDINHPDYDDEVITENGSGYEETDEEDLTNEIDQSDNNADLPILPSIGNNASSTKVLLEIGVTENTVIDPKITSNDQVNTTTIIENTTKSPCMVQNAQNSPSTYQVYPEVVKFVETNSQNYYLYVVIVFLVFVVIVLIVTVIHLRAKQRSYRPVSYCDGNSNKMTNLKKINDYP